MPAMPDESRRRPGLDRFRSLEAEGGIPLDAAHAPVAVAAADELPFRRCASCGMDAHRTARSCEMCGADLRTAEQERFNRELQRERKAQEESSAREAAALARSQAEAAGEQRRLRAGLPGTLSRPELPALGDDLLGELLRPGGARRATGRLALGFLYRAIQAVPAMVWVGLAGLLLASVAFAKAAGQFGPRQLLLTGILLVPIVTGILVGRPLRRAEKAARALADRGGAGRRGVPPGGPPA